MGDDDTRKEVYIQVYDTHRTRWPLRSLVPGILISAQLVTLAHRRSPVTSPPYVPSHLKRWCGHQGVVLSALVWVCVCMCAIGWYKRYSKGGTGYMAQGFPPTVRGLSIYHSFKNRPWRIRPYCVSVARTVNTARTARRSSLQKSYTKIKENREGIVKHTRCKYLNNIKMPFSIRFFLS